MQILYGDVSVMIHYCAGKILVQENIAPVDGYVQLVHIFKRMPTWYGTLYVIIQGIMVIICMSKLKNTQEMKDA